MQMADTCAVLLDTDRFLAVPILPKSGRVSVTLASAQTLTIAPFLIDSFSS